MGPVIRTVVALDDGYRLVVTQPKDAAVEGSPGEEVHVSWKAGAARLLRGSADQRTEAAP